MDFNLPLLLKDEILNLPLNKLSFLKDASFKDILELLDNIKRTLKEELPHNLSFKKDVLQNINRLENFKPSFKNLPALEKILDDISNDLSQNFPKKSKIQKNIQQLRIAIKDRFLLKDIQQNSILLKNETETIFKEFKDNLNIKNFDKKIDNFLKLISNNTDKKDLYSSFKEMREYFNKIKNISPQKISPLQKHIDTISRLLNIQSTQTKEIKNLKTLLKEMITTRKQGKVSIIGKEALIKNLENITKNIDTISSSLPNEKKYIPLKAELKNFTLNIQEINLEKNIKNSGVFYEAKLFKSDVDDTFKKELVTKDVKAILLKLKSDESLKENHQLNTTIDKTITQINTVQTNAILTQTLFTYIPFGWDNLKDGSLSISNLKKKDKFSCKIELNLESYGQVDIMMLFAQDMVSLNMDIKNEKFKNILQAHRLELKKALQDLGYDTAIFFGKQKNNRYDLQSELEMNMGMDIKI